MRQNQQDSTKTTLAPAQMDVISALVRGSSVTDATRQANVDRGSYYVWVKSDAAFKAELNQARQEQAEVMRGQLRGLADAAVSTIREMLTHAEAPANVRLRAALAVLQAMGALESEPLGPTDSAEIEKAQEHQSFMDALSF